MIDRPKFARGYRGYRRTEVDQYLDQLEGRYKQQQEEFESRLQRIKAERDVLNQQIALLREQIAAYEEKEKQIVNVLVEAQKRYDEIIAEANIRAEANQRKVLEEIAASRADLNRIRAQTNQFKQDFARMLESYQANLVP